MCASLNDNYRFQLTGNSRANIGDANHGYNRQGVLYVPSNDAQNQRDGGTNSLAASLNQLSLSQGNRQQLSKYYVQSRRYEGDLDDEAFNSKCDEFLRCLQGNCASRFLLGSNSIGEHEWRGKRLTASYFGRVVHTPDSKYRNNFVKNLLTPLSPRSLKTRKAIAYGLANEQNAIDEYEKVTKQNVEPCELFVHPNYAYLAGRPDGLIGEDGILEVKCPYSARSKEPFKIPWYNKSFYCFATKHSKMQLKKGHTYYHQIQGMLEISDRKWCDFVVWTRRGIHVERIHRDRSFWEDMFPKLEAFYKLSLLPEIIDPRIARGLPIREPDFVVEAKNGLEMRRRKNGNQRK